MRNEEIIRRIQFMIEQQARFWSDIQRLKEAHVLAQSRHTLAESRLTRIEEAIVRLVDAGDRVTNAQLRTDNRLNEFITVVERSSANATAIEWGSD